MFKRFEYKWEFASIGWVQLKHSEQFKPKNRFATRGKNAEIMSFRLEWYENFTTEFYSAYRADHIYHRRIIAIIINNDDHHNLTLTNDRFCFIVLTFNLMKIANRKYVATPLNQRMIRLNASK